MDDTAPTATTPPERSGALAPSRYAVVLFGGMLAFPAAVLLAWMILRGIPVGSGGGPSTPAAPKAAAAAPAPPSITIRRRALAAAPNPFDPLWNDVEAAEIAVMPQQLTMPALEQASVPNLRVQAVHDGAQVAWRLSWKDPTPDGNVDVNRFCDAVAIQFPLKPGSSAMMGLGGGRVQLIHWKALWQKDHDAGYQDVPDLHPNMWSDLYWFADGSRPVRVPQSFADERSHAWFIAMQAGNPMAVFSRPQPVEEGVAEGFGTLTTQRRSDTRANGAWVYDTWAVVLQRPMTTDDPDDVRIVPDSQGQIAFAVWQGSGGNVGGRKHWCDWVAFRAEP